VRDDLHTRMILLGRGWRLDDYTRVTGMKLTKDALSQQALG